MLFGLLPPILDSFGVLLSDCSSPWPSRCPSAWSTDGSEACHRRIVHFIGRGFLVLGRIFLVVQRLLHFFELGLFHKGHGCRFLDVVTRFGIRSRLFVLGFGKLLGEYGHFLFRENRASLRNHVQFIGEIRLLRKAIRTASRVSCEIFFRGFRRAIVSQGA